MKKNSVVVVFIFVLFLLGPWEKKGALESPWKFVSQNLHNIITITRKVKLSCMSVACWQQSLGHLQSVGLDLEWSMKWTKSCSSS